MNDNRSGWEIGVIAELTEICRENGDWDRVAPALAYLSKLPDNGIAALAAALDKKNGMKIRHFVMQILFKLEPEEHVIPSLIDALCDPDRVLRLNAVDLISRYEPGQAVAALPIFDELLKSDDSTARLMAAIAICKIAPEKIPELLPLLMQCCKDNSAQLDRLIAIEAIGDLDGDVSEALPLLETLLTDENPIARCEASKSISKIIGDRSTEISVGVTLLRSERTFDRHVGASHLMKMGNEAKSALEDLRQASNVETDEANRKTIAKAIQVIEHV